MTKTIDDLFSQEILSVFKNLGMKIETGAQYSVKGQIAQLLNGAKQLCGVMEKVSINSVDHRGWFISMKQGKYLYNDGKVRETAASKEASAFWPSCQDAVGYYLKWNRLDYAAMDACARGAHFLPECDYQVSANGVVCDNPKALRYRSLCSKLCEEAVVAR